MTLFEIAKDSVCFSCTLNEHEIKYVCKTFEELIKMNTQQEICVIVGDYLNLSYENGIIFLYCYHDDLGVTKKIRLEKIRENNYNIRYDDY